jgi:hypothetical protein
VTERVSLLQTQSHGMTYSGWKKSRFDLILVTFVSFHCTLLFTHVFAFVLDVDGAWISLSETCGGGCDVAPQNAKTAR